LIDVKISDGQGKGKSAKINDDGELVVGYGKPIITGDLGGYTSFNSTFGETITSDRDSRLLEQFQYNINTLTLTKTEENNGTVTQDNSMAVLTSSTTSNGRARLETKRSLRYRAGHEGYAFFTALWQNGGKQNSKQYIGLFDANNGFFIGFNGQDFVVGRRKDTVDYVVMKDDFNGNSDFDTTKLNIFMIRYGWLGTAPVDFWAMDAKGNWVLIHRMEFPNSLTEPSITNPVLPMAMEVVKTSGSDNLIMKSASWHCGTVEPIGSTRIGDRYFSYSVAATGVSTEQVLFNFRNQSTFQSKTNRVEINLEYLEGVSEGTKPAIIKIYKNLAIGGTPSWSDINATNSVAQTDVAGTVTPATANILFQINLAKSDSHATIGFPNFYLLPGDTLTVTGQSAVSTDLNFYMLWRELF